MTKFQCRVCKNTIGNTPMVAREMALRTFDEFLYFKCAACGCLQIESIPENLRKYYPADSYYSYQHKKTFEEIKKWWVRLFIYCYFKRLIPASLRLLKQFRLLQLSPQIWFPLLDKLDKGTSILDVGCGDGLLLKYLHILNFKDLTGIDPFIEKDFSFSPEIKVYKRSLSEHAGKYDLIMMHHSFEHMENPLEALKSCNKLLSKDGLLLIRIPVSDCFAFRKYTVNWYQLDAPRHFFLHTTQSISYLAQQTGFTIDSIKHDSTIAQFVNSEKYSLESIHTKNSGGILRKIQLYIEKNRLNHLHDGDQACFLLKK